METPKEKPKKTKRPTPFELAFAAKEGKIKPEDLKGASKVLYNQHSKETLAKYLPKKPLPPTKKSLKPAIRLYRAKS